MKRTVRGVGRSSHRPAQCGSIEVGHTIALGKTHARGSAPDRTRQPWLTCSAAGSRCCSAGAPVLWQGVVVLTMAPSRF